MMKRLFSALALTFVVGCGPSSHGTSHLPTEGRTTATVEVSEDQFASAVRDLLSSAPSTAERQTRLEGVLARQMDRAHTLFRKKSSERGLTAVKGALYLARAGDLQTTTLGPHGSEALESAVKEIAQRGDEGRSRALYEVLLRIAPQQKKADVQSHLEALASWTKDGQAVNVESGAGAGMDAPSEAQRVALTRALLEPSAAALDDATKATVAWFTAALHPLPSWSRWDRVERARALQSASATILALHLRDADPRGAVAILDHNEHLRQTAPRRLFAAVAALADKPDGERWREVLDALLPTEDGEDDPGDRPRSARGRAHHDGDRGVPLRSDVAQAGAHARGAAPVVRDGRGEPRGARGRVQSAPGRDLARAVARDHRSRARHGDGDGRRRTPRAAPTRPPSPSSRSPSTPSSSSRRRPRTSAGRWARSSCAKVTSTWRAIS